MKIIIDKVSGEAPITMMIKNIHNKSEETNQKPAGGFLIAHFKRYKAKTCEAVH